MTSNSFTEPAWSRITRSCSQWSTIFSLADAMKSWMVLLGHPARRNAIGHVAAVTVNDLKDLLVPTDRLWDLTQPISVSDCRCGVHRWWSWWSLRLQSDWTSAFRSAMTFFARTSVLWVLHHLVLCAYSHAICSFCSCRFGTSSLNSLMLFESASCGTACGDLLSSVCHQRTVSAFPTFFY